MSQHPAQADRRRPGLWYVLTPILSVGLLACAPFWHAYTRLSRAHQRDAAKARRLAIVFTAVLAGGLLIPPVAGFTALAGMIIAPILVLPYRSLSYGNTAQQPIPAATEPAGALAVAQQARALRAEARRIVQDDPAMARELGIGRPGRGNGYDDGGLLDLNGADAQTIAQVLDASPDMAERIVTARREIGGAFRLLDEVITFASLTEGEELVVRERGVLLPR